MKKVLHILLISFLALSIVMIGKGVNLVICSQYHTIEIFPDQSKDKKTTNHCGKNKKINNHCASKKKKSTHERSKTCDPMESCMIKLFYSLSQSEISPELNLEIAEASIPDNSFVLQVEPVIDSIKEQVYVPLFPKPPSDYLNFLTVLLI